MLGNTTNGTGELNYNQTAQSNNPQGGKGPQLIFDKNYLCMKARVGEVEQDKGKFLIIKRVKSFLT